MTSHNDSAAYHRRGPGRPRAGSEDKRERILNEAVELFGARGYAATSLADIAQAADISKAGLLHHFTSKEELFAQVLARRDAEDGRLITTEDHEDMWAALEWWVGVVERNTGRRSLVSIYTAMTASVLDVDHPAHGWMVGHLGGTVDMLAAMVDQGKVDGVVRPEAPSRLIARTLVALSDGLQIQWLAGQVEAEEGRVEADSVTDMVAETRMVVDMLRATWALDPR